MSSFAYKGQLAPLSHQVYFWLNNPESAADRAKLIAGLQTLLHIETLQGAHIGVPAATEERGVIDNSYSVSWLAFFANEADEQTYQTHPLHLQFVNECESLWHKVVVYDAINTL